MRQVATEFLVYEDAEQLADEAARRILDNACAAIAERGRFRIVLAGGTTPLAVYSRLAECETQWQRWEVFFGDERCLAPDDPERNSRAASLALLGKVPIRQAQVHPIEAELGPEIAALAYTPLVEAALPFDLVLLGMGEDGHTASLFSGHAIAEDALVIGVRAAPKPPPERVSLTPRALATTGEVLILVTGAGKREALAAWRAGADLPVTKVADLGRTMVLVDRAAAGPGGW